MSRSNKQARSHGMIPHLSDSVQCKLPLCETTVGDMACRLLDAVVLLVTSGSPRQLAAPLSLEASFSSLLLVCRPWSQCMLPMMQCVAHHLMSQSLRHVINSCTSASTSSSSRSVDLQHSNTCEQVRGKPKDLKSKVRYRGH